MNESHQQNPFDIKNPRSEMERIAAELAAIAKETIGLEFTVDEITYTPEALNAVLDAQAESQSILDAVNAEKAKISSLAEANFIDFLERLQKIKDSI